MRESSQSYFVGLDIGTQTVRCVVGMVDPVVPGKLSIVGHGSAANLGMRKGIVVHVDDVVDAVNHAITETERVSGVEISNLTVNINGSHVAGINSRGVVAISTPNREITADDRLRSEEAATIVQLPPNREIIQVFAKNYRLDGQDNIKDPVGMHGVRLEVDTHIVTALAPNVRSVDMVLERANLYAAHHTVSSLAAAEAVMNRQQKESGTLLLDIGAGTTNLAIIEDGEIHHVAVLPIGGINITNDLAIGLKTDLDIAEKVKLNYATLKESTPKIVRINHEDNQHSFQLEDVVMITESRVEELLELVEKELKKVQRYQKLPGGVVLVGGTAKLPGLADFTKEKLGLASRIGKLQPVSGLIDVVDDPSYATAVGLMMLDMLLMPNYAPQSKDNNGIFGMVENALRRFKKK